MGSGIQEIAGKASRGLELAWPGSHTAGIATRIKTEMKETHRRDRFMSGKWQVRPDFSSHSPRATGHYEGLSLRGKESGLGPPALQDSANDATELRLGRVGHGDDLLDA